VCAQVLTAPRAVLVGNAAQTIHPIGAQGFNLGLRDVLTLAEELVATHAAGSDPGAPEVRALYAQRRRVDREQTMAMSDGLVRLFANRFAPLRALRSLGLLALDVVPGLSDGLVAGAMGFRGDVPRLARGDVA
jgi:2-octaprenyl-6-methoxyphenol hydroxylase